MEPTESLIVPAKHEEITKELHDIVTKLKHRTTPPRYIKRREDGFLYAEFSYMVEEMDKYHPVRKEEINILPLEQTLPAQVVVAVATVTDLVTRETRTGVDAHRVTFPKNELHRVENIVDLGNDIKSATTEALRHAYSRFGVCADLYQKQFKESTTKEQNEKFNALIVGIPELPGITKEILEWVEKNKEAWSKQTKQSADEFLKTITVSIQKIKERYGTVRQGQDAERKD